MQLGDPREHVPVDTQEPVEDETAPVSDDVSESTGGGIPGYPTQSIVLGVTLGILFWHFFRGKKLPSVMHRNKLCVIQFRVHYARAIHKGPSLLWRACSKP
jgi:hypothetical protein